jgi:2-phospho-L-lactate/phosphoenolpyruvate guanylyltransferase
VFAVLLPVKEFRNSKQRLAEWLSSEDRALLARTMFEDVWATLRSAVAPEQIVVISSEKVVVERCRAESIPCIEESAQSSHSDSVAAATRWAMDRGTTSLLSVPIDTPGVTAEQILALAELGKDYSVVVVASADGTGTNALLRTPPDAIAPRFGPGSCELHAAQARAKGLSHLVHAVPSLEADIDTLEDAEHFLSLGRACRTTTLLRGWLDARPELRRRVALCP